MRNRLILKLHLLEFIQIIVDKYAVSKEEIDYFSYAFDNLNEEEFMFKLELVFGSYMYIDNITVEERIAFARGMEAFIKVNRSKINTDFSSRSDEFKKNKTLSLMKKEYSKEHYKLMYCKGIDAGIDLDNEYSKKMTEMGKVRKKTLS